MTLNEWIVAYDNGEFDSRSVEVQIKAGWFDWFCNDSSLANRLKRLAPKVKKLAKSDKINPDHVGVIFKNNCPLTGGLYDDFRFVHVKDEDVLYTVIPKTGHKVLHGAAELWGRSNSFNGPIIRGTWKDICTYFGV